MLGKNMKARGNKEMGSDEASAQDAQVSVIEQGKTPDSGQKEDSENQTQSDLSDTKVEDETGSQGENPTLVAEIDDLTSKIGDFMAPPQEAEEPVGDFQNLRNLMDQSRKANILDEILDPFGIIGSSGLVIPSAAEVAAIENGERLPTIADLEAALERGDKVDIKPDGTVSITAAGPQPNGDYGVLVVVKEPMVSGVLGQAEMDGVSPSEWLSVRVAEYLEGWFFGK
jgi:hypothetical protein